MPKNKVSDPITDQEIAFARLVLSGTMTDRRAAEAVGINPNSAAYTKAKPRVRAYMREHRAAVQQQFVQQQGEELHRLNRNLNIDREQVLARLWEIASLSPEMTRGSITGQVKALAMIIAMQSFIPGRVAALPEKKPSPAPNPPQIYVSAWRAAQQATTTAPPPGSTPAPLTPHTAVPEAALVPAPEEAAPPPNGPSHPAAATHINPSQPKPPASYVPLLTSVPDAWAQFMPTKNPFARRR